MGHEKIKILAIDDQPDNLLILDALIKDIFPEVTVLTAVDGPNGIRLAITEDPDVVLLDVVMPSMDGFTVCKELKADTRTKEIPVVFITAHRGDKANRIRALEVGAEALLSKPVDENELTAQLRAMIKIKQANNEKRTEQAKLSGIVDEKNVELRRTYVATLNLLEDLNRENEARKKNEEALRKAEGQLENIFQSVNEGIIYTDMTGEVLANNSYLENMIGIPPGSLIGKNSVVLAKELLSVKEIRKVLPVMRRVLGGKTISSFELDYKDRSLEISVIIKKETRRITGVVRDITERKRAEEALIKSEQRFRSLVENAFDGIYLNNGKYFTFVNERFCEITGWTAEELTAYDFDLNITLSEMGKKFVAEQNRARRQGHHLAATYELQILSKTGDEKVVEVSTINLGHGNELNVLGIVRDITERKKMEAQALQSDRLSSLGEMSAGMAHEINQPLNTLSILLDNILLEARINGSVDQAYLKNKSDKIFDNITRIRKLIDHVRDFSRSHEGYILSLFNINDSIHNALSMVSEQFRIKGIELELNLDENLPLINGNIYKFEQVILNFISNARDAILEKKNKTGQSYNRMSVSISTSHDRNNVYVLVKDNGIGISKENLKKVMQPFYTTKETGKGTGLGLSISYGIIKEMDGKIEIESEPMEGTTVNVTIPVK